MTKVFTTTVLGVGPWCVEFDDGEIITCRTQQRAQLIADHQAALADKERECWQKIETEIQARHITMNGLHEYAAGEELRQLFDWCRAQKEGV